MKRTPARFVGMAAGVVTLFVLGCALAHESPLGDISANVTAEGGDFVVKGWNPQTSTATDLDVIRQVFDVKGRLREERRVVERRPQQKPYADYSFIAQLKEDENGLEREWNGATLIVPESTRKHGGWPYVIVHRDGKFSYHKLGWKKGDVEGVVDALIQGNNLYLLVTRFSASGEPSLSLNRFSLTTWAEEAAAKLPKPALIYSFPVCSNLIEEGGKVYLGVVSPLKWGHRLLLVGWDGTAAKCSVRELTRKVDWNTSLSLAHIGGEALIAYHHPEGGLFGFKPGLSRIQAVAFSLD